MVGDTKLNFKYPKLIFQNEKEIPNTDMGADIV